MIVLAFLMLAWAIFNILAPLVLLIGATPLGHGPFCQLAHRAGLRRVRFCVKPRVIGISCCFVVGPWKWILIDERVLAAMAGNKMTVECFDTIMAHELGHLAHGDSWKKLAANILILGLTSAAWEWKDSMEYDADIFAGEMMGHTSVRRMRARLNKGDLS